MFSRSTVLLAVIFLILLSMRGRAAEWSEIPFTPEIAKEN